MNNILAQEMASPENRHCANCIGTLSFRMAAGVVEQRPTCGQEVASSIHSQDAAACVYDDSGQVVHTRVPLRRQSSLLQWSPFTFLIPTTAAPKTA